MQKFLFHFASGNSNNTTFLENYIFVKNFQKSWRTFPGSQSKQYLQQCIYIYIYIYIYIGTQTKCT